MRTTGQIISQTVENYLAEAVSEDRRIHARGTVRQVYSAKLNELADYLGVSRPYMPRKIKAGTWSSEDIDRLAKWFHCYPVDLVPGPDDDWGLSDEEPSQAGTAKKGTQRGGNPENSLSGRGDKMTE